MEKNNNNEIFLPVLVLLGMFGLILATLMFSTQPEAQPASEETEEVIIAEEPTEVVAINLWEGYYNPDDVAEGRSLFGSTCAACHGSNAEGISGLGKDLIHSDFMQGLTDDELREFIIVGREAWDPANTTGIPMPARGGNPALSDNSLNQIIAFLRTTANPALIASEAPHLIAQVTPQPTREPVAVVENPTAIPSTPTPSEPRPTSTPRPPRVFNPSNAFAISCSGCHGADGKGIEGLTTSLLESELLDDPEALFNFIVEGNPLANPVEEFPHPVRGEYPTHTDEEIQQLIDYLLTLRG